MKRIFTLFLALAMISTTAFARAGKSYSRSSSKSHSSSSYSSPSRNYSSPSYSRSSQSYTRPSGTSFSKPHTATPASRPAPVATPTPHSTTTVNRTTNNYSNDRGSNDGYNRNNNDNGSNNNGGSGMGIMGTIAGVGGGIVVGNLLTSALMGHPSNAGHAPAGGYASQPNGYPVAGQPVAPAMAGAAEGTYVTDGNGGFIPAGQYQAPTSSTQSVHSQTTPAIPAEPSFDWFSWYMWLAYIALGIALIFVIVRLYKRWQVARLRKLEVAQMLQEEQNLGLFRTIFMKIQQAYASESRVSLINVTTPEMYQHILLTKSSNDDQGLTNIVEEVQVLSLVNVSSWNTDGVQFQQVKIRFSMLDYVVDDQDVVHHGSKDTPEKVVEYWTFESRSKDSWQLCAIDQHSGYVHQA